MVIIQKSSLVIKKRTLNIISIVPRGLDGNGGIETFSNELKCRVVKKWPDFLKTKFLCTRGTESILCWPLLFIPRLLRIIFYLFFKKTDVIHLNVSWGVSNYRKVLIALIANIAKIPIITHSHAGGLDRVIHKNFFWLKCFGLILKKSSKVVVLGNMWVDVLSKRFNISKSKFSVIRNGVHDNNPQGIIAANNIVDNRISISFIGKLGSLKGTAILLEALRRLKADKVNFKCIFAGDGDINKFLTLSKSYGIEREVEFLGWVDRAQVNNILKNSNIFVLPSGYENFPMSIVEAMSYGSAIITTPVGVIPEILEDGKNAKLVTQNEQEIYEAIKALIENLDLRVKLGKNARKYYIKNLTPEKTLDKLIKLFITMKQKR